MHALATQAVAASSNAAATGYLRAQAAEHDAAMAPVQTLRHCRSAA